MSSSSLKDTATLSVGLPWEYILFGDVGSSSISEQEIKWQILCIHKILQFNDRNHIFKPLRGSRRQFYHVKCGGKSC